MDRKIADDLNILGNFLGERDVPDLTADNLREKYNFTAADVMVLFGGSILAGGDVFARGMRNAVARKYVIAGGAGHTTETLREKMKQVLSGIQVAGLTEAELFSAYLNCRYNLKADFLECRSTNCGNNITYVLDLLKENNVNFNSIILLQDASMQRRMGAVMRKYVPDKVIINYAVYNAEIVVENGKPGFRNSIAGMWDAERYITLLMGEIPRLSDNKDGYGPEGKNYLAHVDIPEKVISAFNELKKYYSSSIREANPLYAS